MRRGDGRQTIAVVMAAYNASAFVDQALASVAAQTRPPDEIVVVDDRSGDDTADRVAAWSGKLPLRLLRQQVNGGPGAARAEAMRHVRSELVTFLDADDVLFPHHLEHLAERWQRTRGIVSPRAYVWRPGGARADYHATLGLAIPRRRQLARLLADNYVFYAAMFARADYEWVGGLRPMRLSEDWDLWVRLVAGGAQVDVAEEPTVLYRRHTGNATADSDALGRSLSEQIASFRAEHPTWLPPREWTAVTRRRESLDHGRRAAELLRAGRIQGLVEMTRATPGGWSTVQQFGRRARHRTGRVVTRKSLVRLR